MKKLFISLFNMVVFSLFFPFSVFAGEGAARSAEEVARYEADFFSRLEEASPVLLINGEEVPLVVDGSISTFALTDVDPVKVTYEVIQGSGSPASGGGTVWIPETSNSNLQLPGTGPNWWQEGIINFYLPSYWNLPMGDLVDISLILITKNIEIHDNNEYGTTNMSVFARNSVSGSISSGTVCNYSEIGGAVATFSWNEVYIPFDTNVLQFKFNFYFNANDIAFIPSDVALDSDKLAQEDTLNEVKAILESTRDGYDASAGDSLNQNISNSFGELENAEDVLRDEAFSGLDDFDIGGQDIEAYGSNFIDALIYVSTLLQNIFTSSGSFNILISIGFTITICAMLIGLYKFYK